jgi:ABC-2 type transport system ATP-binding protein
MNDFGNRCSRGVPATVGTIGTYRQWIAARASNLAMNSTLQEVLCSRHVSFAYPGEPALIREWSASIGSGITLAHGDTGSGKSTLLRVIAGQLPFGGTLALAGVRLDVDPQTYRRHLFFHEPDADPASDKSDQITARETGPRLNDGDARFDSARWEQLVAGFALTPHFDKPMYMLSTGSRRKLWLAAALASGRPLILLDEPTGGLDAPSTRCLWAALTETAARGDQAVIVASAGRIDQVPLAQTFELPLR